jgi:cell division protein FtsL
MSIKSINAALNEAKKKIADAKIERSDLKSRAKIMKAAFKDSASKANVRLA